MFSPGGDSPMMNLQGMLVMSQMEISFIAVFLMGHLVSAGLILLWLDSQYLAHTSISRHPTQLATSMVSIMVCLVGEGASLGMVCLALAKPSTGLGHM